ncbi:unnamed protein product [Moneuplotes crassus]|uniref:Uncharacterized protein n=1 Tax=Euplotes crassus TaxID=5936 RepID=A0AAD1XZ89_EUPCR|nr:unnamed protein product [Moneuplotes crassus]
MKIIYILFLSILSVSADVCENDSQSASSALSGSFGMSCCSTEVYFLDVFNDQKEDLMYFIGYFMVSTIPWDTIVYKTDHNLQPIKVMTYDINSHYYSYAIDPNGDFIYMQDKTTHSIFEIRTTDLVISRELSIRFMIHNGNCNMVVTKGFYFSFKSSSVLQVCKWDTSSTNVNCFTFGVNSHTNFAPISSDLLFFGSIDTVDDQYYLINYNFSDPTNLVWKKSISCPILSCVDKPGKAILSQDEKWIYTMILYNSHFIFDKLDVADGTPQNSGFLWNDSGFTHCYSMKEFNSFIAMQIYSSALPKYKRLILINTQNTQVLKEYRSIDSLSYAIGRSLYQGEELMYHCGRIDTNKTFFFARSSINNIDQLQEFSEETPLFTPVTTEYLVSSTASNPSISSSSKTLDISTSPSITLSDITSATSPSFTTYVALWNKDHIQSVQGNKSVQIDFTWACASSFNYTEITFSLAQTGSNEIPAWVQLDTDNQELYLNKTPKLSEAKTFSFRLRISFSSEIHYKNFDIIVEECNINNCEVCQLGNPTLCEVCIDGYQTSNGQKSCMRVTSATGTTEAAIALAAASMVMISVSSILSLSSMNSIFSAINSLQLALLLPLVPDYFSPKILAFLSGMGFTMLSFDFVKLKDIPFIKAIKKWVSYPQSDKYLNSIGMRSGSSVINYLSLMAFIIFLSGVHLLILLCKICMESPQKSKCKKGIDKLFQLFTFNVYIRIFIQAFAFTTLSIFSEMYALNLSSTVTKVSFGFCIMFALCTSVLFIVSFYVYAKSFPQLDLKKYWLCSEYLEGIKPTAFSKLYSIVFMLLRLMLCSFLIFAMSVDCFTKSVYFSTLNLVYCGYLIAVKPFEGPQDNIIEIINQILFCCLAVPLTWVNAKSDWSSFYENYYIGVFMAAPCICSIICFIYLLKTIYLKFKSRKPINITPKKISNNNLRASEIQEEQKYSHSQSACMMKSCSDMSQKNASIISHPSAQ